MRPKPQELPAMSGPGVAPVRHKDLDRLGDKFIDIRDQKAELAEELGTIEKRMAELMVEKGITTYRWSDQEMTVKPGKTHIKIKIVRNEGVEAEANGE